MLETLEDAVALALTLERAESVREARRVAKAACAAAGRCSFCDAEGHEEAQCEVRVRMKKLWRSSSGGSSSGRGGGAAAAKDGERAEEEWGGGNMALARLASAASARSTQCQCRKHQCGKKATASLWQWNSEAVAFCPALVAKYSDPPISIFLGSKVFCIKPPNILLRLKEKKKLHTPK